MREILDKHFNDKLITVISTGGVINLREQWSRYKAASVALANTLDLENVKELAERYSKELVECEQLLKRYLTEGVLEDKFVLENSNALLKCLRRCNVTIRWLMLHFRATDKKIQEVLRVMNIPHIRVVQCLLHTAQLEFLLKNVFRKLLDSKENKWTGYQQEASSMMMELSNYFSGNAALSRVEKNEELQKWFAGLAKQIGDLEYGDATSSKSGRTISKVIEALEDVEQFEDVSKGLQIKEFLSIARDFLQKMVRAASIKDSVMSVIYKISDFTYVVFECDLIL